MSSPLAYADIANRRNDLIRKALEGSTFVAPYSADPIVALTTGAARGLTALPTGWDDAGRSTTDGISMAAALEISKTNSWGAAQATRKDVKSETITAKTVLQETKALTLGLYTMIDTSTIKANHVTNEIQLTSPAIPSLKHWRLLAMGVDLTEDGEVYIARFLPKVQVTDRDDQAFNDGDDGIIYGVTFEAEVDDDLGFAQRYIVGGPGITPAMVTAMGFTVASA